MRRLHPSPSGHLILPFDNYAKCTTDAGASPVFTISFLWHLIQTNTVVAPVPEDAIVSRRSLTHQCPNGFPKSHRCNLKEHQNILALQASSKTSCVIDCVWLLDDDHGYRQPVVIKTSITCLE